MRRPRIIKIHGTSGSGKTETVRRALLQDPDLNPKPIYKAGARAPYGYRIVHPVDPPNLAIVGSYEATCGGCDSIKTQDAICDRVHALAAGGTTVVFEGLLISQIYGRYRDLAWELSTTHQIVYGFLDTPLDLCVARVQARREARGNFAPLDPSNTESKWHDMRRNFAKYQADQIPVEWVPYQDAVSWLRSAIGDLPLRLRPPTIPDSTSGSSPSSPLPTRGGRTTGAGR